MPFVFGNNFDSLANQRHALNRFQFDVASRNEANRLGSQEAAARLNLAAQEQADRVAAQNAQFDIAAQQAALQAASNAARNQDAARQFSINTALKLADDERANKTAAELARRDARDFKLRVEGQKNTQKGQAQTFLSKVLDGVNEGLINDKGVLETWIEGLPPDAQETARKQLANVGERKITAESGVVKQLQLLNNAIRSMDPEEIDFDLKARAMNPNPDRIWYDPSSKRFIRRADTAPILNRDSGPIKFSADAIKGLIIGSR